MTKYTLSAESVVLAQVRGNKHSRTSQVRLKILNYRTLQIAPACYSTAIGNDCSYHALF
jgi:hypothetical protein